MLEALSRDVTLAILIFFGVSYDSIFADTPLTALTFHSENLKDFPNWRVSRKTNYNTIAYSPNGKVIATGTSNHSIQLWDTQSGEVISTLDGHSGVVNTISYSPDGKKIASGSWDNTIRIWDVQSGKTIKTLVGHPFPVFSVAYSPDSKVIAAGSKDSSVSLWDTQSGKKINTLKGHSEAVYTIAYSSDGKVIASGSEDSTIRLWDAKSGAVINILQGHKGSVLSVAYSSDDKVIASGSHDNTVRLWDTQSGAVINILQGHKGSVESIAYSPDDRVIASGSNDNTLRIWDVESGDTISTLYGHSRLVSSIAYHPDGKAIASGSWDHTIRLWNAQSFQTIDTLSGQTSSVSSIAYSPDGKFIAASSGQSSIRLWSSQSGEAIKTLRGHSEEVLAIAYSPDGKVIASGSGDNTIRLWNAQSGEAIHTLAGHSESILSIAFSPNGEVIASGSRDNSIHLWDAQSGETINILKGHSKSVLSIAYSPDGKIIASGSGDNIIRLWDTQSGSVVNTLNQHTDSVSSIAYSPDGKVIASGSHDTTIRLWNAKTGESINTLKGHTAGVLTIAYSPNGKVIASGSGGNTIRLWGAQSGEVINTLKGHSSSVYSVAFSPTNSAILSSSEDGSIKLWENAISPATKTMIGGKNGNWLSYDSHQNFKRSDDGSMLLIKKDGQLVPATPKVTQPVPNQSLAASYQGQTVSLNGIKTTKFKLNIRNVSQHPLFWIKPRLVSSDGLIMHTPSSIQRLEPGKSTELNIEIGAYLTNNPTKSVNEGSESVKPPVESIQVQLVAPQQTDSNIVDIPVEVNSPKLRLAHLELLNNNSLTLSIQNNGVVPIGKMRFNLLIPSVPKLDQLKTESNIGAEVGEIIKVLFRLPEGLKLSQDEKIDLQIRTIGLPYFVWDFKNQPFKLQFPKWWVLLILLLPAFTIPTVVNFIKRYQHPIILKLSQTPSALLNTPFEQLGEAQQRLTQTKRLDFVLLGASVSNKTLKSAVSFATLNTNDKAQIIAKRLGASSKPIQQILPNTPEMKFYQLVLSEGFPLNIDRVLLCFSEQTASEDVFSVLKQHPETQSRISLIIGTDSEFQRKLLAKTSDTSNKWVAPQGAELTRLLLTADAETTFAEILAGQLSLQQISPYRIGGGVSNESVFFGRSELISQIINRDPANYLMAGGRQVGKSTLLKAIERRYADNPQIECVYLTLSSEVLVPRLASLLKLERTDSSEVFATQLEERIRESGQRFVFLIDEADRFISQEKSHDYAILNAFRRLSEEGSCTFILAGFWQLYQHAALDYQSPIRNFGELLSVGELERPACIELATQPMKTMNLSYANESLVEHIVDSCGHRANLIAIACQHIVRNLPPKQRVIEAGDVDKALRSDELRRALSGWVVGETEHEQAYERMVVYATIGMPSFTTGELLKLAKQHGVRIDTLMLDRTLSRLELAFVLGRNDIRWFYRVPLFVDYIAEDSPELKLQAELSRIGQYG